MVVLYGGVMGRLWCGGGGREGKISANSSCLFWGFAGFTFFSHFFHTLGSFLNPISMSDTHLTSQQQLAALKKKQQSEEDALRAELNAAAVTQAKNAYKEWIDTMYQKGYNGGALLIGDLNKGLKLLAAFKNISLSDAQHNQSVIDEVQRDVLNALKRGCVDTKTAETNLIGAGWADNLRKRVDKQDAKKQAVKQQHAAETPEEKKARVQREKDAKAARAAAKAARAAGKTKKAKSSPNNNIPNSDDAPANSSPISPVNSDDKDVMFMRIVLPESPQPVPAAPSQVDIDLEDEPTDLCGSWSVLSGSWSVLNDPIPPFPLLDGSPDEYDDKPNKVGKRSRDDSQ